jgi:hypothetical protein
MVSKNLKYTVAYLKLKQLNQLKELKESINKEHGVTLSVSQLIRDAVDDFIIKTSQGESRETYLEDKGW